MTPENRRYKQDYERREFQGLPFEQEAEKSILGAILLDNKVAAQVDNLNPDIFSFTNGLIFQAILELYADGTGIDLITVCAKLESSKRKITEPYTTISALIDGVPQTDDVSPYVDLVIKAYYNRKLIDIASNAERMSIARSDPHKTVEYIQERIMELDLYQTGNKVEHIGTIADRVIERAEELSGSDDGIIGITSGLDEIDRILLGWQVKNYLFAGRPRMGKSTLAVGFGRAGAGQKKQVLQFTLEMSAEDYVLRYLASESRIDSNRILKGSLKRDEWGKLNAALRRLKDLPIFIDDTPSLTVAQMKSKIRQFIIQYGQIDLITVDQLNLMKGKADDEYKDMTEFSRGMVEIRKEFQFPVIAFAQLNRKCEERADKRPILADLRGSGSLEQDADVVGFLHREEIYAPSDINRGVAELIIAKHRGGMEGIANLVFLPSFTRFESMYTDSTRPVTLK